jgi:hypothetical protein
MARTVFFTRDDLSAAINFDEDAFGVASENPTPWTISVSQAGNDVGRVVGFEGEGQQIIAMHHLKPDVAAQRGCEITVYRMADTLIENKLAAQVFAAFERWLLRRGWRGNIVKKLKFSAHAQVQPIRRFWIDQGFELIPFLDPSGDHPGWDEHVVKRWR